MLDEDVLKQRKRAVCVMMWSFIQPRQKIVQVFCKGRIETHSSCCCWFSCDTVITSTCQLGVDDVKMIFLESAPSQWIAPLSLYANQTNKLQLWWRQRWWRECPMDYHLQQAWTMNRYIFLVSMMKIIEKMVTPHGNLDSTVCRRPNSIYDSTFKREWFEDMVDTCFIWCIGGDKLRQCSISYACCTATYCKENDSSANTLKLPLISHIQIPSPKPNFPNTRARPKLSFDD